MAAATVTALKDAAKAKREQTGTFNLDDILASATVEKQRKSSSKTPVIEADEQLQSMAVRLRELRDEIDSDTAEFESLSTDFIGLVEPRRAALIKSAGFTSSVKVPDGTGLSVSVTFSSNYSKIPMTDLPAIEAVVGDEFSRFFTKELQITVKDVTDDSLKELVAAVGPERFARFFSVERWVKPAKAYTEQFYTAFDEGQRISLSSLAKQYKPSIKTR